MPALDKALNVLGDVSSAAHIITAPKTIVNTLDAVFTLLAGGKGHVMPLYGPGSPSDPYPTTGPGLVQLPGIAHEPGIPSFATPGFSGSDNGIPADSSSAIAPPPSSAPPSTPGVPAPINDIGAPENTMDLGNLAQQALQTWGAVETARATGQPSTPQMVSSAGGNIIPVNFPSTVPSVGVSGMSTSHPSTPGVKYVGVFNQLGQLVGMKPTKTRRRRHRKLVYKSDIEGLAQLKGVLGSGKAFMEFIAVRGFGS